MMAEKVGFEPTGLMAHKISSLGAYDHLRTSLCLAGAEGVEPSPVVLETIILPLYEAPIFNFGLTTDTQRVTILQIVREISIGSLAETAGFGPT